MIVELEKVISCTSEHPSYPASNLLKERINTSWRCAKPGEMLASVIFQLAESSTITGLDIGNYHSCVVSVTASTVTEPDNWVPLVTHTFMTHDEARAGKFKDQIEIFEKSQLDALKLHVKFDRVKVTCMQTANLRELFGLTTFVLKTESTRYQTENFVKRSKLLETRAETIAPVEFKEKFIKQLPNKAAPPYRQVLSQMINEERMNRLEKCKAKLNAPMKLGFLDRLQEETKKYKIQITEERVDKVRKEAEKEEERKKKEENESPSARAFQKAVQDSSPKALKTKLSTEAQETKEETERRKKFKGVPSPTAAPQSKDSRESIKTNTAAEEKQKPTMVRNTTTKQCQECKEASGSDAVCGNCNKLHAPKTVAGENSKKKSPANKKKRPAWKPKKPFEKLFEDVSFSMSGYQNPHRDEIRRKALKMGAKYIADPNTTDKKCSHLICAFKNTPKSNLLKGHTKIVSHAFIEQCYDKKTRFPWRRFALDSKERAEPESEEEMEAGPSDPYRMETDPESD
ncbi:DNA repair protein XRCC1 [Venturia canescens]|uniref:DNA repair protein XRCC1 n=1 Tax=Venturia canescens TaxID=32260 RepID=UPI001C9D5892|nr:DNA repair protein XRCC1 [Venturia canescens]XP_043287915.1 DNA repair protein XRCC1 [Venturia canescens]